MGELKLFKLGEFVRQKTADLFEQRRNAAANQDRSIVDEILEIYMLPYA